MLVPMRQKLLSRPSFDIYKVFRKDNSDFDASFEDCCLGFFGMGCSCVRLNVRRSERLNCQRLLQRLPRFSNIDYGVHVASLRTVLRFIKASGIQKKFKSSG